MSRINSNDNENKYKVSIIMPAYNCEKYISDSIDSVIKQSYTNWELIIVNDFSTDNTPLIVNKYTELDNRVKLYNLEKNSGAAKARNVAINIADGTFLAFLDSDDIWDKEKLSYQINFMLKHNYHFTCTSYLKIHEDGKLVNNIVTPKYLTDYDGVLMNSPGNSTVVYNATELGKFYSPDIRRRNDFVMWLQVIKKAEKLYGIKVPLTKYRLREDSLSKNKIKLVKYQWMVYRKFEKLPLFKSLYLLIRKIFDVVS